MRPSRLAVIALSLFIAACGDVTSPAARPIASTPLFGKSTTPAPDTTAAQVPNAGGNAGGGSSAGVCGTLSSNIQTYKITVYTTRVGIGFSGTATNCGGKKEAFEVDIVDMDPNPACTVAVPHFIAAKNTDPGASVVWAANSTLVPCQGKTHNFVLTLWDTKTKTQLATTTASAFL